MSKKHYIAIAAVIAQQLKMAEMQETQEAIEQIACALADEFAGENPAFVRARFLTSMRPVTNFPSTTAWEEGSEKSEPFLFAG